MIRPDGGGVERVGIRSRCERRGGRGVCGSGGDEAMHEGFKFDHLGLELVILGTSDIFLPGAGVCVGEVLIRGGAQCGLHRLDDVPLALVMLAAADAGAAWLGSGSDDGIVYQMQPGAI